MEFTKEHAGQIQETRDIMVAMKPMIQSHHKTLYGNGKEGLEKDYLKFKTQVKTALAVISTVFTLMVVIIRLLK